MRKLNKIVYQKLRSILPSEVEIYPTIADEGAKLPFVIYNMDSFQTSMDKDSDDRHTNYTVEVWTDKFNQCDEYSDLIDTSLRGYIGENTHSLISNGSMGYNDKAGFFSILHFDIDIEY